VAVPSARPKRAAKPAAAAKRSAKPTKKAAKAPTKPKAVAKRAPAGGGAYGVQVGAFQAAPQARAAMKQAMKRAPELRGTFASIGTQQVRNKPLFKARLVGLSRDDAEAACKRLKKQKQDCMVIQAGSLKVASR
jgi:D-alanyl-D-alanine carboxypeptidase